MFSALCSNSDFFRDKINLAIMLAPVACIHNSSSKTVQDLAKNDNIIAFIERLGPEILPCPQIDGKISSSFFKILDQGQLGISLITDSDTKLLSQQGLETFYGHFPSGTSFRCVNHFRQCMISK